MTTSLPDGHTGLPMGSGPWIDPADPTLEVATAGDGTAVHLRLLRRDERELVAGFFAGLSDESRRRRFLQPMPRLPEAMLRRLVDVDGRRHVAVVAEADGQCVGIARYLALADEPGAAEVAVTVTDRHQGRGIGRLLLEALELVAVRAGLTSLVYLVDPTNRPALRLLRSLEVELRFRDGLVEGRQRLPASGLDPTTTREVTWATGTSFTYRWPFKMTAEVLEAARPARHVQRLKELLGLVTCTTTARFRQVDGGTELRLRMHYRVAGGPIGRLFDRLVGDEMVTTVRRDLARLKALAEE